MLLEINLYDNISPNRYYGVPALEQVIPAPRVRTTILDYELFETGYEFSSSGIIATKDVAVGDVVEILMDGEYSAQTYIGTENIVTFKRSLWYAITSIDENNRATMQNYYWNMIEGNELPNFGDAFNDAVSCLQFSFSYSAPQLKSWGSISSLSYLTPIALRQNIKGDTVSIQQIERELFRKTQLQPITVRDDSNRLAVLVCPITYPRTRVQTKIDIVQNPALEDVIVTERSNYNTVRVFAKNADGIYPSFGGRLYTLNTSNQLTRLDTNNYTGDGSDLPYSRSVKTVFYDELPADSVIRNEITGDTTTKKIYFNQNPLRPLKINDLVGLWYNGTYYDGSIVDMVHTEGLERLTFIQGDSI